MRISDWSSDVCSSDLQRPGAIAGEAPMETLKAMQPCAEIAIERKQECAAMRGGAADETESMTPVRIVDQEMTALIRIDARRDRQERVAVDGMRSRRIFRRRRNDDNRPEEHTPELQ